MASLGPLIYAKRIQGDFNTGLKLQGSVFADSIDPKQIYINALTRLSGVTELILGPVVATAFLKPSGDDIVVSQHFIKNNVGSPQPLKFDMGDKADSYNEFMITIANLGAFPCDLEIEGTTSGGAPYTPTLFGGAFPQTLSPQTTYTYYVDGNSWTVLEKSSNAP